LASRLAVAAFGAGLVIAAPSTSAEDRLKDVESAIEDEQDRLTYLGFQATQLTDEISRLQQELITTARDVHEREEELTKLEKTLAALESLEQEKIKALTSHQGDMTLLLGALQRLSFEPRETLLLGWRSPMDTVITAQLLGFALPPIGTQAQRLRDDLEEIADLRRQTLRQRQGIGRATLSLKAARESLRQLVALKSGLRQTTEDERRAAASRVRALTEQADDLRELLAALPPAPMLQGDDPGSLAATIRLERPPGLKPFPSKQIGLTLPVRGQLLLRFGDAGPDGNSNHGLTFETQPEGQIVAPHDGQIVFRGPFRGYGEILIIEHRGGYHTLLAGLGRADVVVGQWLLAGEPIGVTESPKNGKARLYVELRRNGQPIDPWPWLEARIVKVE
jgi:septal ring factor EnvC (AmiA/AmiB activator)